MTVKIDRRQEIKMLLHYRPAEVRRVMKQAAAEGGMAASKLVKARAPIGTSKRQGQYYRAHGLGHGTLRKSVKAAPIRRRGATIGRVIGPVGSKAFTRHWVEARTHWLAGVAGPALAVAYRVSDAVLTHYARTR